MTTAYASGLVQRGQMTLPKPLREQYHLKDGDQFTIIDLGGKFLFVPQQSKVDAVCDQLRDELLATGATLEEMLADLCERRGHNG
jgi:AbrB family looped-hinge helix DNA binding protein